MSRVTSQQDVAFEETITDLRNQIDQKKTANQGIGSDSIIMKVNKTGATWDVNAVSVLAFAPTVKWRVTFTPTKMPNVYATFRYDVLVTSGNGYEVDQYMPDVTNTTATARSWIVAFTSSAMDCYVSFKFYVLAPDGGTITVVAI
jgi:hypothetical protein